MSAQPSNQHMPRQPRSAAGQWTTGFAMLGGATAWVLHLSVMYFLVQPVCRLGGEWSFHIVTVLALVACLAAGAMAWRHRDRDVSAGDLLNGEGSWKSFVALFGVAASAIFAYAIVYQWLPVLTTSACAGMRALQ